MTNTEAVEQCDRPLEGPEYVAQMRALDHPANHILKTWPPHFDDVALGRKSFEVRKNDRDFRVGDYLDLVEYDMNDGAEMGLHHTGRSAQMTITFMLNGGQFGVEEGYVVLGIEPFRTANQPPVDQGEVVAYRYSHPTEWTPGEEFGTIPLTEADKAAGWSETPLCILSQPTSGDAGERT